MPETGEQRLRHVLEQIADVRAMFQALRGQPPSHITHLRVARALETWDRTLREIQNDIGCVAEDLGRASAVRAEQDLAALSPSASQASD